MKTTIAEAIPTDIAEIVRLPVRRQAPKQDHRFKILEFSNPRTGSNAWRVTGSKRDGERVRENFKDEISARARQIELETEYLCGHAETTVQATKMTADQVQLAEVAFIKLGDDWKRLLDAVDHWKATGRKQLSESPKIDDAVAQYQAWLAASTFRDATKQNWKNRMNVFMNSVAQHVRVCEVDPDFIDKFLATRNTSPGGKDTDRRAVSRFFSWCIERPRRWTATNPCREVRVEKGESAPPAVLSIAECAKLLRAAEAHKGGLLVSYVAACMFGGLRPFEVSRLTWQQVNLADKEIRLEGQQTKTGRARVVTINPTLLKWLRAHNGKEFFPANWRKEFDAVKLAAGFGTPDQNDEKRKHLKPWPEDVMRHTSISHFFRESGSYGLAAEQFGNSEAIIKAHYQGRVSSADTKKFYALAPKGRKV